MHYFRFIKEGQEISQILNDFQEELPALRDFNHRRTISEKLWRNGFVIVLFVEDEECGVAAFYANDHRDHVAFLSLLAVKEKYRGLGFGSTLLDEVTTVSMRCGMRKLRLEVRKENKNAINFYLEHGFTEERGYSDCCATSTFMIKSCQK